MRWLLLLLLVVAALSQPLGIGLDPATSTFQLYSPFPSNYTRLRGAAALHAPYGTAIYGNSTTRLLSGTSTRALCEWDLLGNLSTPLRCVQLGSVPRDLVYLPHPRYPYVLITVTEQNSVLALDYTTFQLDQAPWFSSSQNAKFLGPTAIEYDPNADRVYVALETGDCVMVFTGDGTLVNAGWAILPRPRFLVLDKQLPPSPSLFVLTSDLSLPEIYRFRLSDGSSLSTLANLDGDWYPDSPQDSLASIALDDNGILYALWTHADGITAFSMQDASALSNNATVLQDQPSLLNPVAMVRQETAGSSNIELVVDEISWNSVNGTGRIFEACTPGVASGGTQDGSSILSIWQCPRANTNTSNTGFIVTTDHSVYRLLYDPTYSRLCFDSYLVYPGMGWNISGSALNSDSPRSLLVSTPGDSRRVYQVQGACSDHPPGVIRDLGRPLDYCPSGDHCVYFSPQIGVLCMLAASLGGTVSCTNGVFSPLSDMPTALLMRIIGVSFQGRQLWVGLSNGTALSFSWPDLELYNKEDPADATNVTYVAFTIDVATGGAVWLLTPDSPTPAYLWTSTATAPSFMRTAITNSSSRRQSLTHLPVLPVFSSQWAVPYVAPTLFPTQPVGPNPRTAALWAMIALIVVILILVLVICCVCCRQYPKQGDAGANIKYHQQTNEGEVRLPPHIKSWRPVRSFFRRAFCCLQCCYDDSRGILKPWACYWCLGGDSKTDRERRNRLRTNDVELRPPGQGTNPFSLTDGEGTPSPGEPFVAGGSASLTSVSLVDKGTV